MDVETEDDKRRKNKRLMHSGEPCGEINDNNIKESNLRWFSHMQWNQKNSPVWIFDLRMSKGLGKPK